MASHASHGPSNYLTFPLRGLYAGSACVREGGDVVRIWLYHWQYNTNNTACTSQARREDVSALLVAQVLVTF